MGVTVDRNMMVDIQDLLSDIANVVRTEVVSGPIETTLEVHAFQFGRYIPIGALRKAQL